MSIQLGLERIHTLISHLPIYTRPTIHIAGTNGKGSVAAILSSIFHASSISVGRFNSPHLLTVQDCISINGQPISEALYKDVCREIEHLNEVHQIQASPFEVLTAIALVIFERANVDIVVLEAGMGGRLDATNVVSDDCIRVSALTAVDLDHQAFLGNTVAAITKEKAAIARKGKPFVLGAQTRNEVEGVVNETVGAAQGILLRAIQVEDRVWDERIDGVRLPPSSPSGFVPPGSRPILARMQPFTDPLYMTFPLHGDHQLLNLGLALAIISALITYYPSEKWSTRITPALISDGIKTVSWLGRLSYEKLLVQDGTRHFPLTILVDGAHNAASAFALAQYLHEIIHKADSPLRLHYIFALSYSPPKTPNETLSPLFTAPLDPDTRISCIRFSPPASMPWVKSVPPSEIQKVLSSLSGLRESQVWVPSDEESGGIDQLRRALGWLSKQVDTQSTNIVVISGSLYLVADLYRLLDQTQGSLVV